MCWRSMEESRGVRQRGPLKKGVCRSLLNADQEMQRDQTGILSVPGFFHFYSASFRRGQPQANPNSIRVACVLSNHFRLLITSGVDRSEIPRT